MALSHRHYFNECKHQIRTNTITLRGLTVAVCVDVFFPSSFSRCLFLSLSILFFFALVRIICITTNWMMLIISMCFYWFTCDFAETALNRKSMIETPRLNETCWLFCSWSHFDIILINSHRIWYTYIFWCIYRIQRNSSKHSGKSTLSALRWKFNLMGALVILWQNEFISRKMRLKITFEFILCGSVAKNIWYPSDMMRNSHANTLMICNIITILPSIFYNYWKTDMH